jgi:acyl-coenzyme A synthetase/AMP-(fatty) acid ligase
MINAKSLTCCPPQWLAGLAFSLNAAVFIGLTTVMLPPDMNLTSPFDRQAIIRICQQTGVDSILTPPALIEDFYTDTEAFDFLKSLKYVCWLGAGLDHKVGDVLASHTNLFPVIGSTEQGARLSFDSDDVAMWKSYEFVPEMGARFELVADELYELYIDRTSEDSLFQCGFFTFPDLQLIDTEELYTPVVDKHGSRRWVAHGRKDDLVKLSWLAKFHATHIENAIARHSQVAAVIVGGEGRAAPYIIIEPKDWTTVGDPDKFLDELYNTVIYSVNEKDNDEIRIPRETIMLSDPILPFRRTLKMTIMRKEVERTYEEHIEALYLRWEMKRNGGTMNGYVGENTL